MSKIEDCIKYECDECKEISFENKRVFEALGGRGKGLTVLHQARGRLGRKQEKWFCSYDCLAAWAENCGH